MDLTPRARRSLAAIPRAYRDEVRALATARARRRPNDSRITFADVDIIWLEIAPADVLAESAMLAEDRRYEDTQLGQED